MGGEDNTERKKGKLEKSYFDVLGICCSSEVPLIEKILYPLDGVSKVSVIVASRTVIVLHDSLLISDLQIANALNKARLEANVRVRGGKFKEQKKKWPSPYAIVSGMMLLLSLILQPIYHPLQYLALGAVAVGILPILLKGFVSLRNFNLDINILVVLAVGGSIALKDYWEAGTIVFLFTIAEWLESKASHRATAAMSSLANIVPQTAVIAETGEQVNADQVKLNTILAVKPGDIIPIDGIVAQGNCDVDEKTLTGESFPVSKQIDSTVWAGTINLNGYISVKTTALAEDCVVARMANLVEEAQNNKSKTQRLIDKCAKYYTPIIVAISGCLAIIPPSVGAHNLSEWYHLSLVVLVSACPCALILSTPVATFCALSNAATSGLLVKGAEHLETLAKVKIMAFDKTGTVTKGEFVVAEFKSLLQDDDISFNRLLHWVASIESKSSHPMAAALVEYTHSYSVEPKPNEVEEFHNFPGEGIYGKIDGKDIYIGNKKIANRAGCETLPTIGDEAMEGKSIGYIFSGSFPAGVFSLSDVCRTGVKEAINELKSMGIKTAMLTGDCHAAAKHAQDQIGGALEIVHAELLPEDKARIIKAFQNESATAMIGDGLNDAAALATADIGITMGISGSALAMETGNIILMSNDIRKIPKAARLARRTRWKIIQNIFLSLISKAAVIALAIAGHPLVWLAVLADVGTCLLVIFNSMLLLGRDAKHGKRWWKFSRAGHGHKHCSKTAHSHSAHVHKHCCPSTETVKKHTTKKCSEKCSAGSHSEAPIPATCGIEKNIVLAEIHGCCGHNDHQTQEVQHNVVTSESKCHVHQHCCSGNQVETNCMPQQSHSPKHQCESFRTKPCGDIKSCHESIKNHGCCKNDDDIVEEDKHMDHHSHGCCKHDDDILEEDKNMDHFSHGCCEHEDEFEQKHMDHGSHDCCEHNHKLEEEKQKEHDNHNCCEHNHKLEEEKHKDHDNHNSCEHNHKLEEEKHMHNGSCGEEKSMDSVEKGHGHCQTIICHHPGSSTTNHQHVNNHRSVSPSTSNEHIITISNNRCHIKHCGNEHTRDYITEDALSSMVKSCCSHQFLDHKSYTSKNVVCSSLKRRHVGGCCNSFQKECYGSRPLFGAGFGGAGGVSEIVIE